MLIFSGLVEALRYKFDSWLVCCEGVVFDTFCFDVVSKGRQQRGQAQIAVGHGAALAVGVPAPVLGTLGGGDAYILTTKGVSPPGSIAVGAAAGSDRGRGPQHRHTSQCSGSVR